MGPIVIYDCFLFFDELELLDIRLNYLNPVIDRFVIVESTKTFSLKEKPLYYLDNEDMFKDFRPKIISVVVDDFSNENPWENERYQRDSISRGIKSCDPNDIIILSDCDEIPRREKISEFNSTKILMGFMQKMYYYYLNGLTNAGWCGSRIFLRKHAMMNPSFARDVPRNEPGTFISDGGWHFSFLATPERIKKKIESFSHQEYNKPEYTDVELIKDRVECGEDLFNRPDMMINPVPIDETYPDYIRENIDKFDKYIWK